MTNHNRTFFSLIIALPLVLSSLSSSVAANVTQPSPRHPQVASSELTELEWLMADTATGSRTEACRRSGICY